MVRYCFNVAPRACITLIQRNRRSERDCLCFKFLSLRRKPEVHVLRTSCFGLRQNSRCLALANDRSFRDENAVTISFVIERVWTLPVLLNLMLLVTLYVQKVDRICNVQVYPGSLFTFLRFIQWWGYLLLLAKSKLRTNRQKGSDTSVHPVGLATEIFSSRVCYRYWFSL